MPIVWEIFLDNFLMIKLWDLGFVGKKFTWFKNYPSGGIWERLDRAVSMVDWLDRFPASKVQSLVCGQSDHSPILILPEGILAKPQRPWRFENLWLERDGCQDTVAHSWDQPTWVLRWLWRWEKLIGAK